MIAPRSNRRCPAGSPLRGNLALAAASLSVTLLVCELVARALLPCPLPWKYPQLRYRSDPALVFALAPGQRAFTADKPVAINSRGLRGPEIPYERTPGRSRLLFLGDSIVFGYGVSAEEVVTARVQRLLGDDGIPADVINTGVPAYNTEQEVDYFEREGVRYRPDWVIVGVCWNDVNDKSGARVTPEGWLTSESDRPAPTSEYVSESPFGYAVRNALKSSRLLYSVSLAWRALQAPQDNSALRADVLAGRETERVASGWEHLAAALHRLHALEQVHGFRTLLVAFPLPTTLDDYFPHSSYPARLSEIAAHEGIPMIDLEPVFRAAYHGHESLFIPYDGDHPNALGHLLAARRIAAAVALQSVLARNGEPTLPLEIPAPPETSSPERHATR